MVVLWVVFEDLGLLWVIEAANELIKAELLSPLLAVDEPGIEVSTPPSPTPIILCVHLLGESNIELSGAEKSQLGRS